MLDMLSIDERRIAIKDSFDYFYREASFMANLDNTTISIRFDLKGKQFGLAGGRWKFEGNVKKWEFTLRFNLNLLIDETEIHQTVGHEVAHCVTWIRHGCDVKPHGEEWQLVMRLFKLPALREREAKVPVLPSRKVTRVFNVACGCEGPRSLSLTRYNRLLKGMLYRCTLCNQHLKIVDNAVLR